MPEVHLVLFQENVAVCSYLGLHMVRGLHDGVVWLFQHALQPTPSGGLIETAEA